VNRPDHRCPVWQQPFDDGLHGLRVCEQIADPASREDAKEDRRFSW
jgi:hypothetical protein